MTANTQPLRCQDHAEGDCAHNSVQLLTDDEMEALDITTKLAGLMRRIIGNGPNAHHDWSEIAATIHHLQHALMSQAAARAYPHLYRTMGRHVGDPS